MYLVYPAKIVCKRAHRAGQDTDDRTGTGVIPSIQVQDRPVRSGPDTPYLNANRIKQANVDELPARLRERSRSYWGGENSRRGRCLQARGALAIATSPSPRACDPP